MRRSSPLTAVVWSVALLAAFGTALPPTLAFGCCCGTCATCSQDTNSQDTKSSGCCEASKPACCSQSCCESRKTGEEASSCFAAYLRTGQECSCPGCTCHIASEQAPLTSEEVRSGKELLNDLCEIPLGIPTQAFAPAEDSAEPNQLESPLTHPLAIVPARILFGVWLN